MKVGLQSNKPGTKPEAISGLNSKSQQITTNYKQTATNKNQTATK